MRTTDGIVAHYYRVRDEDIFGHVADVLFPYLSSGQIRQFLKEKVDAPPGWQPKSLKREVVLAEMQKYMEFAWGKVENHRGLSAGRSVEKMCAWLWLLEDEATLAFAQNDANYAQYGAPILKKICEVYNFPVPEAEGIVNMAQGKPCYFGCTMGCGTGLISF